MKGPYPDTTNCVPEREHHTHDVKFSHSFSRSSTVKENHGYVLITSMLKRQASNQTDQLAGFLTASLIHNRPEISISYE